MDNKVAILKKVLDVLTASNQDQEGFSSNQLDKILQKVNSLHTKLDTFSCNPQKVEGGSINTHNQGIGGGNDPTEDEQFLAVAVNISTEVNRDDSGIIDVLDHPLLKENLSGISVSSLEFITNLTASSLGFSPINLDTTTHFAATSPNRYSNNDNSNNEGLVFTYKGKDIKIEVPHDYPPNRAKLYSLKINGTHISRGEWNKIGGNPDPRPTGSKTIFFLLTS